MCTARDNKFDHARAVLNFMLFCAFCRYKQPFSPPLKMHRWPEAWELLSCKNIKHLSNEILWIIMKTMYNQWQLFYLHHYVHKLLHIIYPYIIIRCESTELTRKIYKASWPSINIKNQLIQNILIQFNRTILIASYVIIRWLLIIIIYQ